MQERHIAVKAVWDEEALVWAVVDLDLPGLAAEAETIPALVRKLESLVPELVMLNRHLLDWDPTGELPIQLMAEQSGRVRLDP